MLAGRMWSSGTQGAARYWQAAWPRYTLFVGLNVSQRGPKWAELYVY